MIAKLTTITLQLLWLLAMSMARSQPACVCDLWIDLNLTESTVMCPPDTSQSIRTQGGVTTRYAHDALGRRTGAWTQASALRGAAFKTSDLTWRNALAQTLGSVADGGSDAPVSAKASAGAGASALNGLMKEYRYDLVGELRTSLSTLNGQIHHRYDATGRVEETHRLSRGANTVAHSSERFGYDPAGNILDPKIASKLAEASQSRQQRGYVRDNRVRVFEDKRFAYDGHGRLIEKKTAKHTVQRFEWDDEHRLTAVHTTRHANDAKKRLTQTTTFDYDAIGRRVAKHDAFGTTRFIWEGMRLIEERRGAHVVSYVYEPGSYVPLAHIDASGDTTQQGGIATEQEAKNTDYTQAPSFTAPSDWASTTNQTIVNAASHYPSSPDLLGRNSKELNQETLPSVRHSREGGNPDRHDALVAANDPQLTARGEPSSPRASRGEPQAWEALLPPANLDAKQANADGRGSKLANVYYFHTDQVGLPEELSDDSGNIRWRASYKTWGATVSESWDAVSLNGEPINPLTANAPAAYASEGEPVRAKARAKATNTQTERDEQIKAEALEQNLRFQGQYLDRDTGLHYNTFRYYDADIGRFISPDPTGLDGGINMMRGVSNPQTRIDALGLTETDGSGRPISSPQYSVWSQYELPTDQYGRSRGRHFQWANEQLNQQLKNDPALAKALGQDVVDHVKPGARGAFSRESPPGMSWHHNAQDPTKIELVPRSQHQSPGAVQGSLHPEQEGGFKKLKNIC